MKRILTSIVFTFICLVGMAQSIPATVVKEFNVNGPTNKDLYTFHVGDDVTLYGYKKKGDKYHFIIATEDYANHITMNFIPFDKTEKELKKLPNGNTTEMDNLMKEIRNDIEKRKRYEIKQKALAGKFKAVVKVSSGWISTYGKDVPQVGDTVIIIGYKKDYSQSSYALYNDKYANVYIAYASTFPFNREFDWEHMPSSDDADVTTLLNRKKNEIKQKIEEEKRKYQEYALQGNILGVFVKGLYDWDIPEDFLIEDKDTVHVIGYSKSDKFHNVAMYNEKGAYILKSKSSMYSGISRYIKQVNNEIKFEWLPSTSDPKVLTIIDRQKQVADSIHELRTKQEIEELKTKELELIAMYKAMSPVFIKLVSWNTNSIGGVEDIEVEIMNCSPTQTIKYISFQGYFTNPVGDKCQNEIGGDYTWKARGVGPIGPAPTNLDNFWERFYEMKGSYNFDDIGFYSRTAQYIHISSVTIQYMNGKSITLSGTNLEKHLKYE